MTKDDRRALNLLRSVIGTRSSVHQTRPKIPDYNYRGKGQELPSKPLTPVGSQPAELKADTPKRERLRYTGTKVLGVATMHKSNLVPVFSEEEAVDVAKMRRG